jgi:hypothetical protein
MHRIDHATAAASIPTPDAAGTAGYFTKGDPGAGTPATVVTADWANAVQEELAYAIVQGGGSLSKTDRTQLWTAIKNASLLTASNGYQKFPSGLIMQWVQTTCSVANTITMTFPIAFPAAYFFGNANITSVTVNTYINTGAVNGGRTTLTMTGSFPVGALFNLICFGN